jgi:hypothetical protein
MPFAQWPSPIVLLKVQVALSAAALLLSLAGALSDDSGWNWAAGPALIVALVGASAARLAHQRRDAVAAGLAVLPLPAYGLVLHQSLPSGLVQNLILLSAVAGAAAAVLFLVQRERSPAPLSALAAVQVLLALLALAMALGVTPLYELAMECRAVDVRAGVLFDTADPESPQGLEISAAMRIGGQGTYQLVLIAVAVVAMVMSRFAGRRCGARPVLTALFLVPAALLLWDAIGVYGGDGLFGGRAALQCPPHVSDHYIVHPFAAESAGWLELSSTFVAAMTVCLSTWTAVVLGKMVTVGRREEQR